MSKRNIAIIGAGPAGLSAAIEAAEAGAIVTIYERNAAAGKKLLMTGNGKCNLTNARIKELLLKSQYERLSEYYFGHDIRQAELILRNAGYDAAAQLFEKIGISIIEKNGYIYPASEQAVSVRDAFIYACRDRKIEINYKTKATGIIPEADGYMLLLGNEADGTMSQRKFERVIIAAGSRCQPDTGSDGFGYKLLKKLNIDYYKPLPALTKLYSDSDFLKSAAGVRWHGNVSLICENQVVRTETGEIQFLKNALSGIVVFQLSSAAAILLSENKKVSLSVDLFPQYAQEELQHIIDMRIKKFPLRNINEVLNGFINSHLADAVLEAVECESASDTSRYAKLLSEKMKNLMLEIKGTGSFSECQTCSGGVDAGELNNQLMLLKYPGIYIAGELLDIDGICGGYNLQMAFSSGIIAGKAAAMEEY